jgi:hypothetical protein
MISSASGSLNIVSGGFDIAPCAADRVATGGEKCQCGSGEEKWQKAASNGFHKSSLIRSQQNCLNENSSATAIRPWGETLLSTASL